jgi:hypothetical protein
MNKLYFGDNLEIMWDFVGFHFVLPDLRNMKLKEVMSTWRNGLSRTGRGDNVNEYGTAAAAKHPFNSGKY